MNHHQILDFYRNLFIPSPLPKEIEVMNPYDDPEAMRIVEAFYTKYYRDNEPRKLILGINPGRFGGGITGIPFTDPVTLEEECGFQNNWDKRHELSSRFIYRMINDLGGPEYFYQHCFIGAVSPLGFVRDGKNVNYYDDKSLEQALAEFIINALRDQLKICGNPSRVYILGQGKNMKYLQKLNQNENLFEDLIPLPHPRWVMQYRLKKIDTFIDEYRVKLFG